MYGKEASNRKQEIDRQHHTIPNQRPKDKHRGNSLIPVLTRKSLSIAVHFLEECNCLSRMACSSPHFFSSCNAGTNFNPACVKPYST